MSTLSTVLSQVFVRKLLSLSGYTLLLYDYLLTFSLEVEYIWNGPWTTVKTLFLMNRYGTLIGQTFIMLEETGYLNRDSDRFCVAFEFFVPFYAIFSGESIRFLVAMRACAILGCKRGIAWAWNMLYILYALVVLAIASYMFNHAGVVQFEYLSETGICLTPAPPNVWKILFMTLVLDSFILVIVFYSLYRMTRESRSVPLSPLVRLLARDALLFYIATLFNSLLCIASWTVYSQDPRNFLQLMISVPFLAIIGQRLVLNLRRLRARPNTTRDLSREIARQVAAMSTTTTVDTAEISPTGTWLGPDNDDLDTDEPGS